MYKKIFSFILAIFVFAFSVIPFEVKAEPISISVGLASKILVDLAVSLGATYYLFNHDNVDYNVKNNATYATINTVDDLISSGVDSYSANKLQELADRMNDSISKGYPVTISYDDIKDLDFSSTLNSLDYKAYRSSSISGVIPENVSKLPMIGYDNGVSINVSEHIGDCNAYYAYGFDNDNYQLIGYRSGGSFELRGTGDSKYLYYDGMSCIYNVRRSDMKLLSVVGQSRPRLNNVYAISSNIPVDMTGYTRQVIDDVYFYSGYLHNVDTFMAVGEVPVDVPFTDKDELPIAYPVGGVTLSPDSLGVIGGVLGGLSDIKDKVDTGINTGGIVVDGDIVQVGDKVVNPPITGDITDILSGLGAIRDVLTRGIEIDIDKVGGETVTKENSFNFQPLLVLGENITNKFPFSLPWDLMDILKLFDAPPKAPNFEVEFKGQKITVLNLAEFEEVIKIFRFFILLYFITGLIKITGTLTKH